MIELLFVYLNINIASEESAWLNLTNSLSVCVYYCVIIANLIDKSDITRHN